MMSQARWYPTTTLLGNGTVIICGGTINTGTNAINVDCSACAARAERLES